MALHYVKNTLGLVTSRRKTTKNTNVLRVNENSGLTEPGNESYCDNTG